MPGSAAVMTADGYPGWTPASCQNGYCPDGVSYFGGGPLDWYDPDRCRPARVWGRVDYLLWWSRRRFAPTMITTSPNGTAVADAGVLGEPGTEVLFADRRIDAGGQSGIGGEVGLWLTADQVLGIGGRYLTIDPDTEGASFSSNGDPILARPFFDTDQGAESSLLVAYPGISQGTVSAGDILSIDIADAFIRHLLLANNSNRVDFVGGYQYARIDNQVFGRHQIESLDPLGRVPVGTLIDTLDTFDVRNEYQGGFIGLMSEAEDDLWTWRLLTKVAFGNMNEVATIRGTTVTTVPGAGSATSNIGLLALPTNIGEYERDQFVIMPEVHLSATFRITCSLGVSIGYSLVYWTDMVTAGDLIDTTINTTQLDGALVGAARPTFTWSDSQFWTQGLTAGIDWRF
jgi:hypothetical protein